MLDGLPITEHLERCDDRFATAWWHWFFFTQTEKPAEAIINRDPDFWYRADPAKLGPENYADWWRAVHTPEVVFAMVNEYRAGLNVDRHDEAADRAAGRLVDCPTLVGWSLQDDLEELHGDPVAIWRSWVTGPLEGVTIDSGHHMAEEAPEAVAAALTGFLVWKVATSAKKDTGPATKEIDQIVLLLGVADVGASKRFYVDRGLTVGKALRQHVRRVRVALECGQAGALQGAARSPRTPGTRKTAAARTGSSSTATQSAHTDPNEFAWPAAPVLAGD